MKVGDRVKIAPWTDTWMRGERYGEVTFIGRFWVRVKGERSAKTFRFGKASDALEVV